MSIVKKIIVNQLLSKLYLIIEEPDIRKEIFPHLVDYLPLDLKLKVVCILKAASLADTQLIERIDEILDDSEFGSSWSKIHENDRSVIHKKLEPILREYVEKESVLEDLNLTMVRNLTKSKLYTDKQSLDAFKFLVASKEAPFLMKYSKYLQIDLGETLRLLSMCGSIKLKVDDLGHEFELSHKERFPWRRT